MKYSLKALWAIYLRGLIIIRNRIVKVLVSLFLSPLLYAITFGWGVGKNISVEGVPYLTFMIPGLIALSGMNQSFGIAQEMNVSRFINRFFEEYLLSPVSNAIVVMGNILYGMTKGLASFLAILMIGALFGTLPRGGIFLLVPVILNCFMFSSLAVWISLSVRHHRDMASFQSFVITPMSFIAGTFFSLDSLPGIFARIAEVIPLTHSSLTIRAAFLGDAVDPYHFLVIIAYSAFFFLMAVRRVRLAVT